MIKLNNIKPELSRTIYVPENIKFIDLDIILRKIFNFSYFSLSKFEFPGLKTPIWDFEKTLPDTVSVDMNGRYINDYLELFKKFTWTCDLADSYVFTISIRKPNKKFDRNYAFVESFKGDYNPIEDCSFNDFYEMLYCTLENIEFPDYLPDFEMEKFNLDEANENLKC